MERLTDPCSSCWKGDVMGHNLSSLYKLFMQLEVVQGSSAAATKMDEILEIELDTLHPIIVSH